MNYANGVTIHQAKKFLCFLFGNENLIKTANTDYGFIFYFHETAFPNENSMRIKERFEAAYDRIEIKIIPKM